MRFRILIRVLPPGLLEKVVGSTKWSASEAGDQSLIAAFDIPRSLRKVILEVEETEIDRTQEHCCDLPCWGTTNPERDARESTACVDTDLPRSPPTGIQLQSH